ncbi:MAG: SDR family NAD(P)-dependent oxidoreductase [Myxococcales bacterium]|nr:MAG: SDR family NAD(P)-dependent oxidoreductase [Myxococcales bacterium]
MALKGKVALITGASRGIGKAIALALAKEGVHVVVAAKTVEPHPTLPGTIHETAAACAALGAEALAAPMNVREEMQIEAGIDKTVSRFGRLDIVVHNAGALWWKPILDTPPNKFDLVMDVNARAAHTLAHYAIPHLKAAGGGHFLVLSPPFHPEALPGKSAYLLSKFGMTMTAMALAEEHRPDRIAANALWPETAVETSATIVFGLGDPSMWYKPEIVADAAVAIFKKDPSEFTGHAVGVLEVLRAEGVTDFTRYRCDPDSEPPILDVAMLPRAGGPERAG